jgi:hypothetical protein
MLSRQTAVEDMSQFVGDAVRMAYAGVGKSREDFAKTNGVPLEAVTAVVKGQAHTLDRKLVLKITAGLKLNRDQTVKFDRWITTITAKANMN